MGVRNLGFGGVSKDYLEGQGDLASGFVMDIRHTWGDYTAYGGYKYTY